MKPLTIKDAETVILGLQDEIRRSGEARYDHRLHGVLLVAQGLSCPQVAHLLGGRPTDGGNTGYSDSKRRGCRDWWRESVSVDRRV